MEIGNTVMSKILANTEDNYTHTHTHQFYMVTLVKCTEIGNNIKFTSVSNNLILGMSIFSLILRYDI